MNVKVRAPGACGELVQGTIDGQPFLVTCPVDMYSEVSIFACGKQSEDKDSKLMVAMQKTLTYLRANGFFIPAVKSQLPVGKGMASSSADISACCQAVALKFGKCLSVDEIADIALTIEPTDGIFYPGIVLFDHIYGRVRQSLGQPPHMKILIFDIGGEVDTLLFNRREDLAVLNRNKETEVRQAIDLVTRGLRDGNISLIGEGATLSALANQAILYKPCLDKVLKIADKLGAAGVNIAHSGTVLGVMFVPDKELPIKECIENIIRECPSVKFVQCANLIGGGLWKQEGEENEWKICV